MARCIYCTSQSHIISHWFHSHRATADFNKNIEKYQNAKRLIKVIVVQLLLYNKPIHLPDRVVLQIFCIVSWAHSCFQFEIQDCQNTVMWMDRIRKQHGWFLTWCALAAHQYVINFLKHNSSMQTAVMGHGKQQRTWFELLMTKCTVIPSFMPCCSNVSPSFKIFPANIRHTVATPVSKAFATSSLSYSKNAAWQRESKITML